MALTAGTYEARIIERYGDNGDVIRYTVADGTAISKGTLMTLSDPRTVTKSAAGTVGLSQPVAGIAAADKVADDGATSLGILTNCMAELRCDANTPIAAGDAVAISGANNQIIKAVAADAISGAVLGVATETAAVDEEIAVRVKC